MTSMAWTLIWVHFVADFIAQSDQMAVNKSTSFKWLSIHCVVYSLFFLYWGINIAVLVGATHLMVDFVTSKITKRLWAAGKTHWFFTVIGFDQAIHISILFYIFGV